MQNRYASESDILTRVNFSRWWFLSSVFPMVAGTLGPVASAFSICALVGPWRQHLTPGQLPDSAPYVPDPAWYVASTYN
jgi:potassium channel subfamily K